MTLLTIEHIVKRFGGRLALDHVSLTMASGELLALVGPNGSGKSTLLNAISGFIRIDDGTLALKERNIGKMLPHDLARRDVRRSFQTPRIFGRMSVLENLLVAGCAQGLTKMAARTAAQGLLDGFGLAKMAEKMAMSLSGGQAKLIEFASCLLTPVELLLLDEPFSAVHSEMKERMMQAIRDRHRAGGATLIVSHDMPAVQALCPRTICLRSGQLLADGPTATVLHAPAVIEAYLGGGIA